MNPSKIKVLNPRVWGVIVQFKVLKKGEAREVKFNDEVHKVCEFIVGDDTGIIGFNAWDEQINSFVVGKTYEINEARMSVFNNSLKLNMSRKSKAKEIKEEFKVDESNNMSEQFVEAPKKFSYQKNIGFYNKFK